MPEGKEGENGEADGSRLEEPRGRAGDGRPAAGWWEGPWEQGELGQDIFWVDSVSNCSSYNIQLNIMINVVI
jgi:hypothetical protein